MYVLLVKLQIIQNEDNNKNKKGWFRRRVLRRTVLRRTVRFPNFYN